MPAVRNTQLDFAATGNVKAPPGWTKDQKRLLFNHVIKFGEKDWTIAVPGKTGHQCQEQWKKTLLPNIRKLCEL